MAIPPSAPQPLPLWTSSLPVRRLQCLIGCHPTSGRVPLECPQEVADLHRRCLSREPAERPTAAAIVDFIAALPKPLLSRRSTLTS